MLVKIYDGDAYYSDMSMDWNRAMCTPIKQDSREDMCIDGKTKCWDWFLGIGHIYCEIPWFWY